MSSGGVASSFDHGGLNAMSAEEIEAAVEVADACKLLRDVAYLLKAIMRNLDAGVKTIEHGFFMFDVATRQMEDKGVYHH
ncbi:hypothetical protein O9929_24360 [Vibrio lentus]|nr:hypothetical protein [Vibrio lentus]